MTSRWDHMGNSVRGLGRRGDPARCFAESPPGGDLPARAERFAEKFTPGEIWLSELSVKLPEDSSAGGKFSALVLAICQGVLSCVGWAAFGRARRVWGHGATGSALALQARG